MLSNLIKNAVEASPARSTIEVRFARKEDYHISITNRGSVPKELRDTFFEKYQSTKADGMGLGTYSAKLIARTHGGAIDLNTEVDGLTTIVIRLPLE